MKFAALALSLVSTLSYAAPNISLDPTAEPPARLVDTGLFDLEGTPSADLRAYEIIQPLWVDFAHKRRFFYLPPGEKITFSPTEAYDFPVGSVLVKEFQMEMSAGKFQKLETRLLVRKLDVVPGTPNWVGYTYQFNGDEALLVDATSNPELQLEIDATAEGGPRSQRYKVPSRRQCLQCHSASVGFVRSLESMQLNKLVNGANQIEALRNEGLFASDIGSVADLDKHAAIADVTEPLEKRVRSYLAVNCSHCHNMNGGLCEFTGLEFRYALFDPKQIIASGHFIPGDKDASDIFLRMSSDQQGFRMPFIGSLVLDKSAVEAVGAYIDGL